MFNSTGVNGWLVTELSQWMATEMATYGDSFHVAIARPFRTLTTLVRTVLLWRSHRLVPGVEGSRSNC